MKKLITLLTITLISCEKEPLNNVSTNNVSTNGKYPSDTIVVYKPYEKDSIINQVGCYYPIYEPTEK